MTGLDELKEECGVVAAGPWRIGQWEAFESDTDDDYVALNWLSLRILCLCTRVGWSTWSGNNGRPRRTITSHHHHHVLWAGAEQGQYRSEEESDTWKTNNNAGGRYPTSHHVHLGLLLVGFCCCPIQSSFDTANNVIDDRLRTMGSCQRGTNVGQSLNIT